MRKFLCGGLVLSLMALSSAATRGDDAKGIIEKGIQAMGGADKLGKVKAMTWKGKGTINLMGNNSDFNGEWFIQLPEQMKNQVELELGGMKVTFVLTLNGDKGSISFGGMDMEMDADRVADTKEEMYAGKVTNLVALQEPAFKLAALGDSKVGDRPATGVKVSHQGHKDISLFFDKDSGLLLKSARKAKDQQMVEVDQETFYSDYHDVDGVKRYKKMKIKREGSDFIDMQISDFKTPEKLDNSVFKVGQ